MGIIFRCKRTIWVLESGNGDVVVCKTGENTKKEVSTVLRRCDENGGRKVVKNNQRWLVWQAEG